MTKVLNTQNIFRIILYSFIFLRVITPPLVLKWPFEIAILNILVLDNFDVYFASKACWGKRNYFIYDKIMDYWWYIFILLYGLGTPFKYVFIVLFVYRTIGQIACFYKERVLIYFPGIIEPYFFGFVLLMKFYPGLLVYIPGQISLLILATVIALLREYIAHIKKIDVSKKIIGIGQDWKK